MNRINFKAIARHPVARAVVLLSVPYGCLALRVRDLDRRAQIREENIHRDLAEIRAIIKSTELDEKLCQIQEQLDGLHEQFKGIHEHIVTLGYSSVIKVQPKDDRDDGDSDSSFPTSYSG